MASKNNIGASVPAFVLDNNLTYEWTIPVFVPFKGGRRKTKFTAIFKHVSPQRRQEILVEMREQMKQQAEARELLQRAESGDGDIEQLEDDVIELAGRVISYQSALMEEVLVGWNGIKTPAPEGEKAGELAFSDEARDQLLANSWAASALMERYEISLKSRDDKGN